MTVWGTTSTYTSTGSITSTLRALVVDLHNQIQVTYLTARAEIGLGS